MLQSNPFKYPILMYKVKLHKHKKLTVFFPLLALILILIIVSLVVIRSKLRATEQATTSIPPDIDPPYIANKDITYCNMAGTNLLMDVYSPKNKQSNTPLVIYIHGGGWRSGDKTTILNNVRRQALHDLTSNGYVVASINYRLAPKYKFPAMIEDAKCAVRYFRSHAADYSIDPTRIASWGGSAGSHLALLVGLADKNAGWDVGPYLEESSRVEAVVDWYGPTDLSTSSLDLKRLIGGVMIFGTLDQNAALKYSPVDYVSSDDPSIFISQGLQDTMVSPSQSQELADKLRQANVYYQLVWVQNAGHVFRPTPSGATINPSADQIAQLTLNFLNKELKNNPQPKP